MGIRLFATLRDAYPVPEDFTLAESQSIREILKQLGIPEKKASILFINGRHAELTDLVSPGDTLAIFPPIGGG
jgi:molybdopterin converting factor small subunit